MLRFQGFLAPGLSFGAPGALGLIQVLSRFKVYLNPIIPSLLGILIKMSLYESIKR